MHLTKRLHECVCVRLCVGFVAHLQVELCRERPVLHVADVVLGEVQVGEVAKATERRIMHGADLVLVQPQIHDGAAERSAKAGFVKDAKKITSTKLTFLYSSYLLMWEGMAS